MIQRPRELSKKELKADTSLILTVGELKTILNKCNLPDDAPVLVERVEDVYFQVHGGWGVYLRESTLTWLVKQRNKDIQNGKFSIKDMKKQYPLIQAEDLRPATEENIKDTMEQYHPAQSCMAEDNLLFIKMHY